MKNLFFLAFVIVLFFGSCDSSKEPIPAYIHIKPFTVIENSNHGTAAHKITDVWFTPEREGFLGMYQLPATFPVLMEGSHKLFLDPGIKLNGINATPNIYPFLQRFEIEVDLAANEVDTIQPVTKYDSRVKFDYIEDFENNNTLTIKIDTSQNINVTTTADGAFIDPGNTSGRSAKFTVTENDPLFQIASLERMELPTEGDPVYLEMHYKNESLLQVGLVGYRNNTPILTYIVALNPSTEWNKIYIELTQELINVANDITEFQVLLGAQLQSGQTSSTFYVDNIKVMHIDN